MYIDQQRIQQLQPLDQVTIRNVPGETLVVTDAAGREYVRVPSAPTVTFTVGGTLGEQRITALDAKGRTLASLAIAVDTNTQIRDAGGRAQQLLKACRDSMGNWRPIEWRGRTYHRYVSWIRDHVHVMKGMRYFDGKGGEAVDMFRESQRADGMIWDFNGRAEQHANFYQTAYGPLGYVSYLDGLQWVRMPVENDVEYLWVEGMYSYWKQSGDEAFLGRNLDAAIRALNYSTADPSRWSDKFKLLKRCYTIDTWDFTMEDEHLKPLGLFGRLLCHPTLSKFGVMFGDNTGYAQSCQWLAEMLEHAGRKDGAQAFRQRAQEIRTRTGEVTWLGTHFRHHVPEDSGIRRDLGVDEKAQVSLSNAYSLNRGISHEQAAAIIKTYQRIRQELPPGSPGEWYCIYPPFTKGAYGDAKPWQYVNGGVSPIIAGELARGAFEHGFEGYASDVLMRVLDLSQRHGSRIRFCYTGAIFPPQTPRFAPVDLSAQANMSLSPDAPAEGALPWLGGGKGDELADFPTGRQELAGVPFVIASPSANRGRAALAVSSRDGFPASVEVPINATAGSIYILHTASGVSSTGIGGAISFNYEDGSQATQYLLSGKHFSTVWFPKASQGRESYGDHGTAAANSTTAVAWRGANSLCPHVGIVYLGLDNPNPDRSIRSITFHSTVDRAIYAVLGLTLSDRGLQLPVDPVSGGGPDNWAAAAVTSALMEGLAGVVNDDVALKQVRLSPRWASAGIDEADVYAKYPAANGYVAYRYRHDPAARTLHLTLTGSGEAAACNLLLPDAAAGVASVLQAGRPVEFRLSTIEQSRYVHFPVALPTPTEVTIRYTAR